MLTRSRSTTGTGKGILPSPSSNSNSSMSASAKPTNSNSKSKDRSKSPIRSVSSKVGSAQVSPFKGPPEVAPEGISNLIKDQKKHTPGISGIARGVVIHTHTEADGGRERDIENFSNPTGEIVEMYTLDAKGERQKIMRQSQGQASPLKGSTPDSRSSPQQIIEVLKSIGDDENGNKNEKTRLRLGPHERVYRGLDREGHLYFSVLHRHWNRLDTHRYGYMSGKSKIDV